MLEKFYQSDDSKLLADAAENLASKIEIIGLNLIELRKHKQRSQKTIEQLEQEVLTFVKQDAYRQEYADFEQRMREFVH